MHGIEKLFAKAKKKHLSIIPAEFMVHVHG
jgi:hypothetical protein